MLFLKKWLLPLRFCYALKLNARLFIFLDIVVVFDLEWRGLVCLQFTENVNKIFTFTLNVILQHSSRSLHIRVFTFKRYFTTLLEISTYKSAYIKRQFITLIEISTYKSVYSQCKERRGRVWREKKIRLKG